MSVLWRMVGLAALTLALAGALWAQASVGNRGIATNGGLSSGIFDTDPRLVAWAAHDAVASGDKSKVPELLALAGQWQAIAEGEHSGADSKDASEAESDPDGSKQAAFWARRKDQLDAMASVVDALIQMKVAVPADTLRALSRDFGNDVAVLLSGMPDGEREALSFEFYREQAPNLRGLQYVSAAMLALHPVPGFAADLIAHVKVQATVYVVLPGGGAGGGGTSTGCSFGLSEVGRSDWPMIGQYALLAAREEGYTLLVEGSPPVYARRFEAAHYRGSRSQFSLGPYERVLFIAEMLEISPEEIPWKTVVTTTVEFESSGQVESAVRDFVDQQQQMQRQTLSELETRKLLTATEAETSLPQLELWVNDLRGEGAEPIEVGWKLPSEVKLISQTF